MEKNYELASIDNEALLIMYKKDNRLDIKQELVLRYLYIVRNIAIQMRDIYISFTQLEDIVNEGVIVLMAGLDRFEPEAGVKFETYISKRIRGMIIDLARKQDWLPRNIRKSIKEIEQAVGTLTDKLGRMPTEQEAAAYLHMPLKKYREFLHKSMLSYVLSLNLVLEETEEECRKGAQISSENPGEQPEEHYLQRETKEILISGIDGLKEKEKLVISLYYTEELNMKEISEILHISEPRVSQIHAKAIQKLQQYMENEIGGVKRNVSGLL